MNKIIEEIENAQKKEELYKFNTGDTVRVHNRIKEGNRIRGHGIEDPGRRQPHDLHGQERVQRYRR